MIPRKTDWQELENFLATFSLLTKNFFHDLDERAVAITHAKLPDLPMSTNGLDFQSALEVLCDHVIPQLSASRGPRYWGFVTGGATPVATFADWLVSTFDQNLSSSGDSVATQVEKQTIRWLCQLFDLPESFSGIVTTGATASNFLGALCSRQFAGQKQGIDVAKEGVAGLSVEIFSTTPHASMLKTLGMAGLGQNCVTKVKSLPNSEQMDVIDLDNKLSESTVKAKVIIASAGTVTGTDFDDLESISELGEQYQCWLHVDAAFGIFERLIGGEKTRGLERANSITLDCHKWLNVPYDCGVFLTRNLDMLFNSLNVPAPYLQTNQTDPDFLSLGVENSRRFRALPVWLSLLTYGKKGIADWVNRNVKLAKFFAKEINKSQDYELLHDCQLNVVLFRPNCEGLSDIEATQKTKKFLKAINLDGRVFLSPGLWQGKQCIRAALSNWETQTSDVDIVMQCLTDVANNF
ncbi:pyridoxal phosphate-dependent decarboxylase family protein [Aliikangiella coralliicola]|uniref:Aspartate aminotransferase family protein n=1 Tax=Aliikangiella coralliicola TaxID=2592383 RepID=A0A545U7G3_9GAMM|nr:pyridoxal-dependent decarboxylase [Aliikangiella coralliicola]TQV85410.1 aspartate aminotransferase family protein [Aliikangiella coralliicola]